MYCAVDASVECHIHIGGLAYSSRRDIVHSRSLDDATQPERTRAQRTRRRGCVDAAKLGIREVLSARPGLCMCMQADSAHVAEISTSRCCMRNEKVKVQKQNNISDLICSGIIFDSSAR